MWTRPLRRYLASYLCANLGTQMIGVAVGWRIYAVTGRALDLGYVGLAQFLPALLLTLPAGHLADRVDRARIVAVCNGALAVAALALFALAAAAPARVGPIYVVLVWAGAARAFEAPAGQALIPGLVAPQHVAGALTWSSTAWQLSTIVGPALGGALYGLGGARCVFGVAALLLAVAAGLAAAIHAPPADASAVGANAVGAADGEAADEAAGRRVLAGLRFVRARPILLGAISLDLFAVLLGGAAALLPVYAHDILRVGPWGLGLLRSAPAAGAAAMALVLTRRPLVRRAGPIMLGCVALFGAATVLFGLSRSLPLSLAALVVLGAADMVSVVVRSTVVQLATPDEMRGRVSAVSMLFVSTSSDLGELESGLVAAWLGAVPAVVLGGLGTIAVVALWCWLFPSLRAVDRLDEAL